MVEVKSNQLIEISFGKMGSYVQFVGSFKPTHSGLLFHQCVPSLYWLNELSIYFWWPFLNCSSAQSFITLWFLSFPAFVVMDTKTNRMGEILTLKLFSLTSSPPPRHTKSAQSIINESIVRDSKWIKPFIWLKLRRRARIFRRLLFRLFFRFGADKLSTFYQLPFTIFPPVCRCVSSYQCVWRRICVVKLFEWAHYILLKITWWEYVGLTRNWRVSPMAIVFMRFDVIIK